MSEPTTCEAQRARLQRLGLRIHEQPSLTDIDTFDDAVAVAASAPQTLFARTLATVPASPVAA
jgi:hypothetical protein